MIGAPGTEVRAPAPAELAVLQAIGVAAGERFREIADPRIARCADDPPMAIEALQGYLASGRAWVAVEDGDPVGFAVVDVVDGCAHIEEVAVDPRHGGRGHGSALLDAVGTWAEAQALGALSLTTFRDVPWNRPWYERRGFRVLAEDELTPGLRARREDEAAQGLDPGVRVVMRRDIRGR